MTYEEDAGSPAASMLETKLLINSVKSDANLGAILCSYDPFFSFYPNQWKAHNV